MSGEYQAICQWHPGWGWGRLVTGTWLEETDCWATVPAGCRSAGKLQSTDAKEPESRHSEGAAGLAHDPSKGGSPNTGWVANTAWVSGWMDGRVGGWVGLWIGGWVAGWVSGWVDGRLGI